MAPRAPASARGSKLRSGGGAAEAARAADAARAAVLSIAAVCASRFVYVQLVLIGATEANAHERFLGVYVYLTCWTIVALWLHALLAAADAVLRAAGTAPPRRLTALVHSTAVALWLLVAFMVVAFYAIIWRDPVFQRDSVLRKIDQGVPFGQYMHELHALPALLPLAQACGGLSMTRLAAHTPGPWGVVRMAASFGIAWTAVMEVNRAATGAFPYSFLLKLSLPQRAAFFTSCYLTVGSLAVPLRALVMRLGGAPGTAAARKRR